MTKVFTRVYMQVFVAVCAAAFVVACSGTPAAPGAPSGAAVTSSNITPPPDACADLGGDSDSDGVCNKTDNCPAVSNADQADADGDHVGDACEQPPTDPCAALGGDTDGDGVCDKVDNCALVANSNQADGDGDGIGDACELPPPGGGEGCTPGYWKQTQHFDSWPAAYSPSMLFDDVFENAFPGKTLLDVLGEGGGGLNALGRHTVAALLNGTPSSGVSYDLSSSDVVSAFNSMFPGSDYETLKNRFARFNEQGCPLN